MGAKHPEAVINQLRCNKNEFILAAKHLVKTGVVKSPGDAIRYMEEHNSDVSEIIEQLVVSKQTVVFVEESDEDQTK
tara:strand:- start:10717 stop:10947 length:231 start_codon:yes stop_codon:yes gene_type:complete